MKLLKRTQKAVIGLVIFALFVLFTVSFAANLLVIAIVD